MNEVSSSTETTTATGSEASGARESTDSSWRHAGAPDGFQSEDDALEALLASEDRALQGSLDKEDRELEALLDKEDHDLKAILAQEDGAVEALLASEDRLLESSQGQLEPSQGQEVPGGIGGGDFSSPDDPSADDPGTTANSDPAGSGLAASGADGAEGPGAEPQKILFEGKQEEITYEDADLEVTHDAADGIWIEGMPGDPPPRIGEVLSSTEEGEHSRLKGLSELATKRAADITDTGEKLGELIKQQFSSPPPTHTGTLHQVPEKSVGGSEHGIDIGHGVDAVVALAVVGAAAGYKLRQWWGRER